MMPTESQKRARREVAAHSARAMLELAKRREIAAAFTHLAAVFEQLGISVSCKGMRNPVWTLESGGKVIKVAADGTMEILK